MGTPSCDDCWSKARGQSDPIAAYRALLADHADNQPVLDVDGVRVHQGDALALLRTMPDNSVHAVVTDPPYGLADHKPAAVISALTAWANGDRERVPDGKGFMGRAWDAFVPPPAVWDECLRVLKPGGHMLVFAGTRTVDLMGLSIRLAGFELRDSIQWLYGCLTADAEILTEHGWKLGLDIECGEQVAQWNHATGEISLAPVLETFRAPYDGPMRVLRNADTDQLLTPNHRVYHQPRQRRMTAGVRSSWYEPEWRMAEAAELSTWDLVRLPVAGIHDGPGIGGDDYAALLGWVWTEGGFDMQWNGVRVYQSSVNAEKVDEIAALLDRLGPHKRYDRDRVYAREKRVSHATGGTVPRPTNSGSGRLYTETMWFISGELAKRVRADLPGKRPTYDLLWRMTASEKRAMLRAALLGDGTRQAKGNWTFFQQYEDDLVWLQTLLALIGQAGKVGMRTNRPGGAVYIRDTATTELQARHLRSTWEDYTGEVWCVRVLTGAFIARRNGRVFITGNSGFPKSLDVAKAITTRGGRPEDIRRAAMGNGYVPSGRGRVNYDNGSGSKMNGCTGALPLTPEAAAWQGWGTALKPASEPIIVARKPLIGTVAANVLAHGCGGINVDACRVGADVMVESRMSQSGGGVLNMNGRDVEHGNWQQKPNGDPARHAGRWPANVVLDEHMAVELDAQSGTLTSGNRKAGEHGLMGYMGADVAPMPEVRGDTGGASRFFPVFKYQAKAPTKERPKVDGKGWPTVKPLELMRWLVRLVTPPDGGVVLDPFAGSGTTGQAAALEGFGCVLIERDQLAIDLIRKRLTGCDPEPVGEAS